MNFSDLIGKTFGSLTVREFYTDKTKPGVSLWLCECRCKNLTVVKRQNLISGNTTSCGCSNLNKLEGRVFGNLTVLSLYGIKNKRSFWECKCICGKSAIVRSDALVGKKTTSCGCKKSKALLGKTINNFIVLKEIVIPGYKKAWECKCVCGNIRTISTHDLLSEHSVSCGCKKSELMSLSKGGTGIIGEKSKLPMFIRRSKEYKQWIILCKNNANNSCQISGIKSNLEVHHIKALNSIISEFAINKDNYLNYFNVLFNTNNGFVLSKALHKKFHMLYGYINYKEDDFKLFIDKEMPLSQ